MEYLKINLFDNTLNQPSNLRTKIWVEINDDPRGVCNTNSQIKYKTSMLKTSLCHYSLCAYIHAETTITVSNIGTGGAPNNRGKNVIFKNCAPFTNYISEINNTQVDNVKRIDVVMPSNCVFNRIY